MNIIMNMNITMNIMTGCFNVKTATADWIKCIQEIVLELLTAQMT